jgi:hypothetical protein
MARLGNVNVVVAVSNDGSHIWPPREIELRQVYASGTACTMARQGLSWRLHRARRQLRQRRRGRGVANINADVPAAGCRSFKGSKVNGDSASGSGGGIVKSRGTVTLKALVVRARQL